MLILSYARVAARTVLNIEYDTNTEDGVAASDVAGRLIMSVEQFEKTSLEGTTIKNQVDLNRFIEEASTEKKAALGRELGIAEEEWSTLQLGRFNEAIRAYRESGRADAYKSKIEAVNKAKSVPEAEAKKKIPSAITLGDGKVQRYKTDKVDIAVYREGENYVVYDYNEKAPSRMLSRSEVNSVLEQLKSADSAADVAKTLKTAENAELTSTDQGNVSVSGEISPSARMAIDVSTNGTPFVTVEEDILDGVDEKDWIKTVKSNLSSKFPNGVTLGNNVVEIDRQSRKEMTYSKYMQWLRSNNPQAFSDKLRATNNADEILTATQGWVSEGLNHPRNDSIVDFARGTVLLRIGGNDYSASVVVGTHKNGKMMLYDIIDLTPTKITKKETSEAIPENSSRRAERKTTPISDIIISNSEKKSNSFEQNSQENAENSADFGKNAASAESSSEKSGANTESSSEKSSKEKISELKEKLDVKNIEAYCRENIEDYAGLSAANQSMIRKVIREGRAHGLSEADVLSYARVAARTGLNIEYDASLDTSSTAGGPPSPTGEGKTAGYFDPENNRIVVNPKTTKKQELVLIHELDHALRAFRGNDGKVHYLVYKDADKRLSDETWKQIQNDYADQDIEVSREELLADEASAYYTEAILGSKITVDMLLGYTSSTASGPPSPTGEGLKKKILNFFTGAARAYSKDAKLSREARRHYKNFKKLFDSFAERNKGRNAETAVESTGDGKAIRKTLPDGLKNVDPTSVTEAEVRELLSRVKDKRYDDGTYIPIRVNTPQALITFAKKTGYDLDNLPMAMRVYKARQAVSNVEEWDGNPKDTPHDLDPSEVIEIIKAMDDPSYLVFQTKNERFAEIVKFDAGKEKAYAVIDFSDGDKNPTAMNGYQGGKYNVLVTVYPSEGSQELKKYLQDKRNVVVLGEQIKKKGASQRGLGSSVPAHLNDSPFATIITDSAEKSNSFSEKSAENFDKISKSARKSGDFEPKVAEESGIEKSIGKLGDGKVESVAGRDAKAGARRAAAYSRRRQDMTVGQLRQMVARYTGEKVYTSREARETIDNIWGIFTLSGKNRAKLYEALWQGYNSCKTDNERAEFSYDMAEYITVMMLAESSVANPDKPGALETLSKLKHGIGHLTFGEIERGDLRHVLDKRGYKKFIGRWGYRETMQRNRRRIAVDVFIHNLAEENPEFAYLKELTPQDAILELDRIYERTLEDSKATVGLLDDMPQQELRGMIDDIGMAIYESFRTKGEKSTAAKVIEAKIASTERKYSKLKEKYDELERKYYEEQGRPRKLLNLSYQIQKMKELRLGTFLNATDYKNDIFKQTFEILGSIEFRGDISPKKVRLAMKRLAEWYTADNPVLADMDGAPGSRIFSDYMALLINNIAEGEGGLSMFELDALDNILRHATHIVENFNRVWKGGKWVKADSTAKGFVEVADSARNLRSSADMRKISRLFDNVGKKYLTAFGDPMTLFRYMDGYQDGFFTWAGEELRTGAFRHGVDVMEMKADYDAFLEGKDHKKYVKKASREVVEYGGAKMSKLQYISLYMTMQRQQAERGLAENGFSLIDVNGQRVEVDGFLSRGQERLGRELGIKKSPDGAWKISDEQMKAAHAAELSAMKEKLTDEDLEFIGIIERTLNGKCKELKSSRDMERLGYSNTISGYYYPIVRAMIAKTIDSQGMWGELDRASNISANKDTVKGAAGALWIESADTVFNRHIDAVARYAELSPAIDAINKIFNLDISGNKNKPRSVRTATFNTWQTQKFFGGAVADAQKHNGEAYLKDLLADVQGIGKNEGFGARIVEELRGGFAISALAANPKVLLTQLSSMFASTNILSGASVARGAMLGFGKDVGEEVDKYCSIAKLRDYDSSAVKAQGVIDNVRGVGEFLMKGVGFMDRQVVKMLWGACQVEVESTKKLKVGTEENKVEAGKLLERVLQETQQNSIATEKSAAMRSKSMLMKSLTMFTSDAMKGIGRVIDAFGRLASLKARIKRLRAEVRNDPTTAGIYVQNLSSSDIERYYRTGKTGHIIHKKEKLRDTLGSAVLQTDSEIEAFVRESIKESRNITKGYAVVPKALSDKIATASDYQILTENWFLELSSDDIYHLYQGHSKAKEVGDLDMEASEVILLPQKIDGTADVLSIERYKTQTKIKLGIRADSGGRYIVVELVSSSSNALRMKTAWKVTEEKYDAIKKEEASNARNRTKDSPAIFDNSSLFTNSITENGENVNSNTKKSPAEELKALEAQLKTASAQARKSVGALVMTALYMTLIARAFSWLYAKDEEEEYPVLAFIADVFGGMLGGLPILSDIYDFFVSGYDLSDNVYDTLNGVLEGVSKVVNTAGKMINGEATAADMNGAAIYFAQTVGTVLGLPIRNIRNMVMGLTRRFNPNAAYRMEMLTKSKNYASDFEDAVGAGAP